MLTITAAIAKAVSEQQVYEAIVDWVALGASTSALWLCGDDDSIRLRHSHGYSDEAAARFGALHIGEQTPAMDAIRER